MTETKSKPTADSVWREATELFSNLRGMRPRSSWLTGLSVGAGRGRLKQLLTSSEAKKLTPRLEALPDAEFAVFRSYAQVNLEQAQAAVRLSLIANITIPVGFLVLVNQFFPGSVRSLVSYVGVDAMLLGLLSAGSLLFFAIWYCYAGVFQARNLEHLTVIAAAKRRGAAATAGEDEVDRPSPGSDTQDEAADAVESVEKLL